MTFSRNSSDEPVARWLSSRFAIQEWARLCALFGPYGSPIEVQLRTEEMDLIAERGIAAHWSYKHGGNTSSATSRAQGWINNLVESQRATGSSLEFLENVKVDLFPDEVYLFTPKGDILALPRNATAWLPTSVCTA